MLKRRPTHSADFLASESPERALGLPVDRASALLPTDLLEGDEIIVLLIKPSLWFVLLGCLESLVVLLIVGVVGYLVAGLPYVPDYEPARLVVLLMFLGSLRITWQFLQWISHVYVLTNRRIITVKNFLRPNVFQTSLKKLTHTEMVLSLRERLLGLGSITFATAGTALPESYWLMVRRPLAVHRKIVQTIGRAR